MRRWVSLGGWAGPSLALSKLGLGPPRNEKLPFDDIYCTLDGLIELTAKGFESGYFPGRLQDWPWHPDPAPPSLLFRGTHTCFTQCDLNAESVLADVRQQIQRWERLMSPSATEMDQANSPARRSVTFIRSVIAENPLEELLMVPRLHTALAARTKGSLAFRTVMVVHDQTGTTQPLCQIATATPSAARPEEDGGDDRIGVANPCVVWNLERREVTGSTRTRDQQAPRPCSAGADAYYDGFQTIITSMSKEGRWRQLGATLPDLHTFIAAKTAESSHARAENSAPTVAIPSEGSILSPGSVPALTADPSFCRINGLATVRGSCAGVWSTACGGTERRCKYCGRTDGHAVTDRAAGDTGAPWSDDDRDSLLLEYGMKDGNEIVAAESFAKSHRRGVNETYVELSKLLGTSKESDEPEDS